MRNQKEARYLIEPVAVIYSFVRTLVSDGTPQKKERLVIDSTPVLTAAASDKPLLIVLVVGETVRAANWGLNGYERNTTPELKRRGVINFTDVTACGTSTDVSLPCMFSRVGRKDYDRDRILAEESVLSVIDRAGVTVRWVDNQSGCKGACTDAMETAVTRNTADCRNGVCWDRAMLGNIDAALKTAASRELLVLHSMGNHGPAYWRRTPSGRSAKAVFGTTGANVAPKTSSCPTTTPLPTPISSSRPRSTNCPPSKTATPCFFTCRTTAKVLEKRACGCTALPTGRIFRNKRKSR